MQYIYYNYNRLVLKSSNQFTIIIAPGGNVNLNHTHTHTQKADIKSDYENRENKCDIKYFLWLNIK